ncbi:MAG: dTDP-glucose 4,6-dehydratase [Clostridia bacterium]|nr:dTDP-glucose 4,6-dehydratase [Clostridia bacterium]
MRILVTGGAGFIGCNFIRYEIANYDDTIICVDSLTYAGSLNNLKDVADNKNFKFIKADITDEQAIDDIFKEYNPDIVVNFAAESHVDNSINNPNIFTKTNIFGTQVLMNACLKYKVKRFHQVSTDEVYGDLPLNSEKWCIESAHIKPSSPYAVSKAAADLLALSYKRTYGLPITISRSSNNYGPYQNKEKLVPNSINCLLTGKKIPLYGNGLNKREWIHVDDNCKAIDLIVRKGREGEIYNISTNEEKTNLQVARAILAKMEMGEENIEFVEDRKGHDLKYSMSSNKLKQELGWKQEISFREGLISTIDWYLENKDFLK